MLHWYYLLVDIVAGRKVASCGCYFSSNWDLETRELNVANYYILKCREY